MPATAEDGVGDPPAQYRHDVVSVNRLEHRVSRASLLDAGIAGVFLVTALQSIWLAGSVPGPRGLNTVFAVLLSAPLFWRRGHPFAVTVLVVGGLVGQSVVSGNSADGLHNLSVAVAGYSVACYAPRREALVGFAVVVAGYAVFSWDDANIRAGATSDLWAGAFFGVFFAATWLAGLAVRGSRERVAREAGATAQEQATATAVALERSRIAYELHDIVSHNLSVIVLQAAGSRAAGDQAPADALERIERSARQALVEMRRLLGILRSDDAAPDLAPQPGIADLKPLTDSMRSAGLAVDLNVLGSEELTPALQLTVYRVVQEALTNVIKHAPGSHTRVTVDCAPTLVTIDVTDDGARPPGPTATGGGYGLAGMRERVEIYAGELNARPCPGGGFVVHVTLPLQVAPA